MGGSISYFPMTYVAMLIASLSLSGVPFFTGCYSKDHILELAASQYTIWPSFVFWLASLTGFFTAVYSTRLIYLAAAGTFAGYHFIARKALTEVNNTSTTQFYHLINQGLIYWLATASLIIGFIFKDIFVGPANPFWGQAMWVELNNQNVDGEYLNLRIKLLPIFISIWGIWLSIVLSSLSCSLFDLLLYSEPLFLLIHSKWYVDFTINHVIVAPWLNICDRITKQVCDKGIIEIFGSSGSNLWQEFATIWQAWNSGHLFHSVKSIFLFGLIGSSFGYLLCLLLN